MVALLSLRLPRRSPESTHPSRGARRSAHARALLTHCFLSDHSLSLLAEGAACPPICNSTTTQLSISIAANTPVATPIKSDLAMHFSPTPTTLPTSSALPSAPNSPSPFSSEIHAALPFHFEKSPRVTSLALTFSSSPKIMRPWHALTPFVA